MAPHAFQDNRGLNEAGDIHSSGSQFPKRWQPLQGSYNRESYSGRWGFNEKDAAATVSTTLWMQPAILAASASIDSLAYSIQPTDQLLGAGAGIFSVSFLVRWL